VSANIEVVGVKEQRTCIKFCFELNKTAAETHRMLKEAFGEQALSQGRTFEWFNTLPVQFKALPHGQKGCVFFSGHLNFRTAPETGLPSRGKKS